MKGPRNKYYLLNGVFVCCLSILFLNDHYLKLAYPNWLTGKLSDAAGIIILPLLLAFALPRLKRHAIYISALVFAFWKSPWSQPLIDYYNAHTFIQTSRILDNTDLLVLLLLPLPQFIINKIDNLDAIKMRRLHPLWILLPTIFILMSTAPPPSFYYTRTQGNLACNNCSLTVDYNQDEIISKLKEANIVFDSIAPIDSYALDRVPKLKEENPHVYRLNQLIIEKDTLRNLDFTMLTIKDRKTEIYFNGMQVSADISTWRLYKKLRNYYKFILFRELRKTLKQ